MMGRVLETNSLDMQYFESSISCSTAENRSSATKFLPERHPLTFAPRRPPHTHIDGCFFRWLRPLQTKVKPKVEAMLLDEIELSEALEETLGKEELEKELDAAFEAQGGEQADLSKAFPMPEPEQGPSFKESEVQDAEIV